MRQAVAGAVLVLLASAAQACADEFCLYATDSGSSVQVRSRAEVPARYAASARCFEQAKPRAAVAPTMAAPQDIEIGGLEGRVKLSTTLGPIDLRWPRSVTELFGKTPERAMAEAAMAVSRALQSGDFSSVAQTINQPWQVVFMDEKESAGQVPRSLVDGCHPGWMTAPANIYIVAQRAAAGCSGTAVSHAEADVQLATILVHEMGHAVEYQLLKHNYHGNRMRAEGFATWFEQYAARYSSLLLQAQARRRNQLFARRSFATQPSQWAFRGSAEDYGRASMYFEAVVSRRGVAGLMDVYRMMGLSRMDFLPAIEKAVGWDQRTLEREIARIVEQ